MTEKSGYGTTYAKKWLSHDQQLSLLIERGLLVTDHQAAINCLKRIGYYRLSAYWYPFRMFQQPDVKTLEEAPHDDLGKVTDDFISGASLQQAVDLYVYDNELRTLVLDALERIEISLRSTIAHVLGQIDAFAHHDSSCFRSSFTKKKHRRGYREPISDHDRWLANCARLINYSSETFVKHHKEKYKLPLPIWIVCEVWSFGSISTLFEGMRPEQQEKIAKTYGVQSGQVFRSWLHSLTYLRNVCAHHSRLWNRNIDRRPKRSAPGEHPWLASFETQGAQNNRCFLLIRISRHLLENINPNSSWPMRMSAHIRSFPIAADNPFGLGIHSMGVPKCWENDW